MDRQTVDVRIQDVDLLNSKIFENGWMYVGYASIEKQPLYFAPYFTNECTIPGISLIGKIIHLAHCKVTDILNGQVKLHEAPSGQHSLNWKNGLNVIRSRAIKEEWPPQDGLALFYFDRPEPFRSPSLTKKIYNDTNPSKQIPSQIPTGFSLEYGELLVKSSWFLEQPPA